ncbi:MAG TPA: terminase gpA endonuclease subunit [Phycisphaerae bacterium]|nr:terminase gpA endonuclease subunit [Phycisphaerae bacterium]
MIDPRPAQAALWQGIDTLGPSGERARDAQRKRLARAADRDVDIPDITDPERRALCRLDLRLFLETYLASLFPLDWSDDHRTIIQRFEDVILRGQRYCVAAPRGTGKSTLVIGAIIWALLYGHRSFIALICASHADSLARLDAIRTIVETNDLLLEDFPAPCACVRALEGAWNRCNAQTVAGARSFIRWGGDKILVFPSLPGEPSSGAIIATRSMDTKIRGLMRAIKVEGAIIIRRPDLGLLDDPIGTEEAWSDGECEKRERRVKQDVLHLAGPGKTLAVLMLVTVIRDGDFATRFLDQTLYPDWRGQRFKLMGEMPTDLELWNKYDSFRIDSLRAHGDYRLATPFYQAHRAAMDAGAKPSWRQRFRDELGEISATQYAMNEYLEDEEVFMAELQNTPKPADEDNVLILSANRVQTVNTGLKRELVPPDAIAIAVGVDINKTGCHWVAGAGSPGRIIAIVDYGVQTIDAPLGKLDPKNTRAMKAIHTAIVDALHALADRLAQPWFKPDGAALVPLLGHIDRGWQPEAVHDFCDQIAKPGCMRWTPCRGLGTARNQPAWRVPQKSVISRDGNLYKALDPKKRIYHTGHADSYKTIVHSGLLLDPGERGSIALFQPDHRRVHHSFARHITAEAQVETPNGKLVWESARGRAANHWLDASWQLMAAFAVLEHTLPSLGLSAADPAQPRAFKRPTPVRIEL